MSGTTAKKPKVSRSRMPTLNRVRSLVISIGAKTAQIHSVVNNNKRLKPSSGDGKTGFDKLYEETYDYVLIREIEDRTFSYETHYAEDLKVHFVKLVDFMIETVNTCIFATPNLMIPVRVPMLITNIKRLRLPKYMLYTILLLGSQVLPASRVPKFLSARKIERMINTIRKTLDSKLTKPRMNHIWCRQALVEHKSYDKFEYAINTELLKCYNSCIMLGLHKVDTTMCPTMRHSKQGRNEMEFKRRIYWMVYLKNSLLFGLFKRALYGGLFKSANKLPQSDYEWRKGIDYEDSNSLVTVDNKELIRARESRRVNSDIVKIKCMVFAMHNRVSSFRNQRHFFADTDYQLDFKKYTEISKQVNKVSKMLKKYTFDTLQTLQLYENANFLIIDEESVKSLLFQLWILHIVIMCAAINLCISEIACLSYVANDPWRIQVAKMLCINYALDAVKILRWGYVNIPRTHMDWAVYMMVYWIMMALINASYITDHPDHKEIVEGRAFIFQVLARIESKFQGRGIFSETFSQINKLKAHFHELNKNIYPVPSIIANSAITEMDRNPWFILGTTASVGYLCCLMENSAEALKVLSLEHYTDYHASKPAPSFTKNTLAILSSVDITLGYIYDVFFTPTDKEISQRYKTFNSQKAFAGKNRKSTSNTLQMPNVICRPPECLWTRGSTSIFIKSFFMLIFPTIESIKYENY